MANFSAIQFNIINFHNVLINSRPFQPSITILFKLARAIIQSEPEPDIKNIAKLEWIKNNTHEKVKESLSVIELCVFKNLDRGLSKEIEIGQKQFSLVELYNYLNDVTIELTMIVIDISKKYNVDIPMMNFNKSSEISLK